jgi:uncharacterized protein YutE (UPF0331/DUF86 family)
MAIPDREALERKLGFLSRYVRDLGGYAALDAGGRRREHYAVERLLQLLCESAADIALQFLKARGETLPASYREVFTALARAGALPPDMAQQLVAACGMRNVLTHLYDEIDLDRVIAAVDPAIALYSAFAGWVIDGLRGDESNAGRGDATQARPTDSAQD